MHCQTESWYRKFTPPVSSDLKWRNGQERLTNHIGYQVTKVDIGISRRHAFWSQEEEALNWFEGSIDSREGDKREFSFFLHNHCDLEELNTPRIFFEIHFLHTYLEKERKKLPSKMSSSSTCTLAFDGNHDNGEEIVDPEVPMENVAMATKMDNVWHWLGWDILETLKYQKTTSLTIFKVPWNWCPKKSRNWLTK